MSEAAIQINQNLEEKPGYKHTKLGWIPEDWDEVRLSDLIEKSRKIRYGIVQPGEYNPSGRFMVRGQDYSFSKGWNSPDKLFRVSDDVEAKYKKARLKGGDLILTIVGAGTGHVQVIPDWLEGANITQTTARIAIDESEAHSKFYLQYLNSDLGKKQTYRFIKGGAQPGLNIGDVEKYHLAKPPLPEQQKIARILSTWDKAITKTEQLIAKKHQCKKGLIQQLLTGKKRFKEFGESNKMKETKLGMIPEDWEVKSLEELGEFTKGKGVPKSAIIKEGLPCLTYGQLYNKHNDIIQNFDSYIASTVASESKELKYGDILFAGSGETLKEIGKSAAFINEFKAYAGGDIIIFRKHNQSPKYLGYLLNHDAVNRQKYRLGQGHSVVHIYSSTLKSVEIALPPKEEQENIASVLSSADQEISSLQNQLAKLKEQKKGLMQKLLTGEVRVKIVKP